MTKSKNQKHLNYLNLLPNRVYKFRIIGMALGGIPNLVFLIETSAQLHYWVWWLFSCYIWPHLAFIKANKSKNPYISERNNLIFDTFIAGTWAAFLHFNILPAVILLAITIGDKINSGIKKLWLHSLPFMLLGILIAGIITGFVFQPNTSIPVMLACLPILTIHTLLVALGGNKLIRKVQFQNIKYKELSQNDSLTPLLNRKHWQQQSDEMINTCINNTINATMILIDVNQFKKINDTYGQLTGDDVLIAIANIINRSTDEKSINGRLGGDEFAIIIQNDLNKATSTAETICQHVKKYKHETQAELKLTISIGLAQTSKTNKSFRELYDNAQVSLYKAKDSGNNKIKCC